MNDMRKVDPIRRLIALEAARLMYEDGVAEYRDAKRKAAKKFGSEKALSLGSHLPANSEIHAELQRLIGIYDGKVLPERLLQLRITALRKMELLAPYHPLLVGSVLSGAVTERSDIDIHLFAESSEEVEEFLRREAIPFEQDVVTVRHGSEFADYHHIYLEGDGTVVECSVYPLEDIHRIPKSSITGRPMERAGVKKLKKLIEDMEMGQELQEVGTMTDRSDKKLGEKTSLYCTVCEEERTFAWAEWSGDEFFGYPPKQEYGWECTTCGSKVRVP
jgi:hypothetical protein